jgi:tagatose 1,6-diphosphate aldolase
MALTAGKLWSLRRLADQDGFFTMVAVDQRPGVEALIAQRCPDEVSSTWENIGRLKCTLIQELSQHASAMLLDPQYAYPFAADVLDPRRGLLLTLEQFGSEDGPGGRKTLPYPGWTVEKIKRLGADGVKLMLWWRPDAAPNVLAHQRQLVERVGQDCRKYDIAFLLEPLVYPLGDPGGTDTYHEDPTKRPEMVIETVEEFRQERYGIDIFKLETPLPAPTIPDPDDGTPAAAAAQDWFHRIDGLLDRPWVMLSAGAAAEPFRRILTYAFRAGASGYLAGRAIWWPAALELPDWDRFRARVRADGVPYIDQVTAILRQHGTPWHARPLFRAGARADAMGPDFVSRY